MRGLALVVLMGCGRVGFQDRPVCPVATSIPDPLHIDGLTFSYTNFSGGAAAVPGATVNIYLDGGALAAATTTSDATGRYQLSVPTGGIAHIARLEYVKSGMYTTEVLVDRALDRDVTQPATGIWQLGDGPLWSGGSMSAVYGAGGVTELATAGTLTVRVLDCDEQPIDGVAISLSPGPGSSYYSSASGYPGSALGATVAPYDLYVALNAVAGTTQLSASKTGLVFSSRDVEVAAGQVSTIAVFHGSP